LTSDSIKIFEFQFITLTSVFKCNYCAPHYRHITSVGPKTRSKAMLSQWIKPQIEKSLK